MRDDHLGTRVEELRASLRDERSGEVVFVSHCLLNQNTRYLGGAFRPRCPPEQRVWGGVLKRLLLPAYG